MSEVISIEGEELAIPSCTETELIERIKADQHKLWVPATKLELAIAQAHKSHDKEKGLLEGHVFPVAADVLEYLQTRKKGRDTKVTMVTGALLHDAVVEHQIDDDSFDIEKCADDFEDEVSKLLYRLTRYGPNNDIYLSKLAAALTEDPIIIKIIARLNKLQHRIVNVVTNPEDLARYAEETEKDFLPMANSLKDKELHSRLQSLLSLGHTALK